MNIKNVIILGAGASKSEGGHCRMNYLESSLNIIDGVLAEQIWSLSSVQEKTIIKYFKDFWGININNFQSQDIKFPTFEESLSVLDLAFHRGESFKGCSRKNIDRIRNALIFLIAKILDEKLRGKIKYHKSLVERLEKNGTLKQTTFISLNYDIIIDNILTGQYPKYHLDYGVDFVNFERANDWRRPAEDKSILLLKIHGSLNWLYCPTCNHIELTPKEKGATKAFYEAKECIICNTRMEPVIIPPTFYKEMTNPFIQKIFLTSDKVLRKVEKIFVCGYSFPDADIHIKYLLKRAEQFKGKTPKIFVVNNHQNKTEQQKREEEQRFLRFFGNKKNIHYTDFSFEKFADEGIEND